MKWERRSNPLGQGSVCEGLGSENVFIIDINYEG